MELHQIWSGRDHVARIRGIEVRRGEPGFDAGVAAGVGVSLPPAWGEPSPAGLALGRAIAEEHAAWLEWAERQKQRADAAGGGLLAILETMEDPSEFWAERARLAIERSR